MHLREDVSGIKLYQETVQIRTIATTATNMLESVACVAWRFCQAWRTSGEAAKFASEVQKRC